MIGSLRRLWHSRDWMLIPLGMLAVLAAGWWLVDRAGTKSAAPRYRTDWSVAPGDASAAPTAGMVLSADGYGTVTDAPAIIPPMALEGIARNAGLSVAPDVARFVRAWPRNVRLDPRPDGTMECTLEGPPRYSGKLVLVDGCLRFQPANSNAPGPLVVPGALGIGRDPQNYLALGATDAPPEFRLRVGEPGGMLSGVGCSMDAPVPAPPELARQCGVGEMIRLGAAKRKPACSAAYIERRRELRREERATIARLRQERKACIARNGDEAGCPPDVIPANVELIDPPCHVPPGG